MGLKSNAGGDQENADITKRILIGKLYTIRKKSAEVTPEEMSTLVDLLNLSSSEEGKSLASPTVKRIKTLEQVSELMKNSRLSRSFWIQTFCKLEDTPACRDLGKNIIRAAAQCYDYSSEEFGFVSFCGKILKVEQNNTSSQSLAGDSEMALEILKTLSDKLNGKQCYLAETQATRRFLSDDDIWNNVIVNTTDKCRLKDSYSQLCEAVRNIEAGIIEEKDKTRIAFLFGSSVNNPKTGNCAAR